MVLGGAAAGRRQTASACGASGAVCPRISADCLVSMPTGSQNRLLYCVLPGRPVEDWCKVVVRKALLVGEARTVCCTGPMPMR